MIELLQYFSIFVEAVIAVFGILMIRKKKIYGWGFLITFGIYVFYDFSKLMNWDISANILYPLFFAATLSALFAVWKVYKKR
jgi:hypothetical protein